jgi:hypothetical protein
VVAKGSRLYAWPTRRVSFFSNHSPLPVVCQISVGVDGIKSVGCDERLENGAFACRRARAVGELEDRNGTLNKDELKNLKWSRRLSPEKLGCLRPA